MPTSATDFSIPFLRSRRTNKWHKFADDVLPAWVADMDFGVAPPIAEALAKLARNQEYGYAARDGALAGAFARRMQSRFNWTVDPADTHPLGDLVQASFSSVMAFSEPGDAVVLQLPSYPPFMRAIEDTGRRLIANPMRDNGTRWTLDLAAYDAQPDPRARVLIFCHPQNPTGRAFTRTELEQVAAFAIRHDLIVVSDEIHADIVYPGNTHIPLASLNPEIAARTITITSATKSFNIPSLRTAVMHFGVPALKERFFAAYSRAPARLSRRHRCRCDDRRMGRRSALARRNPGAATGQSRLAGAEPRRCAARRDHAVAGGDLSRLARLLRAEPAVHGGTILPRSRARRPELRRDLRPALRQLRAPQLCVAGAGAEGDRRPHVGRDKAPLTPSYSAALRAASRSISACTAALDAPVNSSW